jgi:hypothetical protein
MEIAARLIEADPSYGEATEDAKAMGFETLERLAVGELPKWDNKPTSSSE